MRFIGARASDWHPDRPDVKLGAWLGAFLGVLVIYFVAAALLGHFSIGDGSPYLNALS
jgi:hypothetical protein